MSNTLSTDGTASSADLHVISLSQLLEGDETTNARLLAACQNVGFFYLDLRGPAGDATLGDVENLFRTSEDLFSLEVEEKAQYVTERYGESKIHGYRGIGMNIGPLKGKKDGFESYMISELGLFGLGDRSMPYGGPEPIQAAKPTLSSCVKSLHDISLTILSSLFCSLQMPDTVPFQDCHRQGEPSTTGIGLLRYLPLDSAQDKVGHISHTDAGSLSMVFSHVGGLQVLMPDDNWQYVVPRPGHAVVNVGDTLTFLSDGKLRSSLHRVVPHPEAASKTKHTVVYLLRPEMDTPLKDREGKQWTAIDWHNRKFNLFRHAPAEEMLESPMLTGRRNYIGYWEPTTKDPIGIPSS